MVSSSKAGDSSAGRSKKLEADLSQLLKQIQASRLVSIREKIEKNKGNLELHTRRLLDAAAAVGAASGTSSAGPGSENMLSARVGAPLCLLAGWESTAEGEKEIVHTQEEMPSSATLVVSSSGEGRIGVRLVKLPYVEKIPPYTSWIFLDRNQRMAEDQSVVGRRRIYYDPYGNETLICSDSDEEIAEPEEEKHGFSEGEDQILWNALQEHGTNQEVLNVLTQFIEATPSEIEERYEILIEKYQERRVKNPELSTEVESERRHFLDKTLTTALDSFDNLFCRRCLIFDCRLHGCSQSLVIPCEKQSYGFEIEENRNPCGDQCYLRRKEGIEVLSRDLSDTSSMCVKESVTSTENLETAETSKMQRSRDTSDADTAVPETSLKHTGKRKVLKPENMPMRNNEPVASECLGSADKKQKKLSTSNASLVSEDQLEIHSISITDAECPGSGTPSADQFESEAIDESIESPSKTNICHGNRHTKKDVEDNITVSLANNSSGFSEGQIAHGWNTMEKDLYLKGIEIFGKNSCLIARNLLSGLKTCMEVSSYMFNDGAALPSRTLFTHSCFEDSGKADHDHMEQEMPPRTRIWRRRGRARKLKYTWKSAGHPSIRKRIGDGKQQSCKQYTPCGCQLMCGKQCSCMHNGTCCEKYCGCSKSCKNRFRGCHCAKSQCRSRQCPCFAAGRECDPDVCRNCWVSCGDGLLGEPPARGDGYQCGNMKLLLKQQQRILLARSDVAGWGAFIKNPVNKNDYLGEYTGELISHKEADKRGKIYDRANSSFLFDLNDQYVLDAYRKGDKLKFANHSSNPNCYAKVMLVAGDHRVGIYAKEHIEASEELFYDYRYGPDQAPAWARKLEGSKRDDLSVSHSRAQKIA